MRQSTKADNGNRQDVETTDKNEAADLQRRAHDIIRQRPLLALTVALAGGYLAGRVLSRV